MCLILHQRSGFTLSAHQLATITKRNQDGFGMMYAKGRKLYTMRMVGTQEEIIAAYYKFAAGRECLIHWRLSTAGDLTVDNAHPFVLGNSQIAMMHNGMLTIGQPHDEFSDTYHFAEFVLKPIAEHNPEYIFTPTFNKVCAGLIGSYNKLAMMNARGEVSIVNRSQGVDWEGNWYSNTYAWDAPYALLPKPVGQGRGRWDSTTQKWTYDNYKDLADQFDEDEDGFGKAWSYDRRDNTVKLPAKTEDKTSTALVITKITPEDMPELKNRVTLWKEEGAQSWAKDYPAKAKAIINDWYDLDVGNISEATIAEFLCEIAEANITTVVNNTPEVTS